jgi:hypothetical protein
MVTRTRPNVTLNVLCYRKVTVMNALTDCFDSRAETLSGCNTAVGFCTQTAVEQYSRRHPSRAAFSNARHRFREAKSYNVK